jgi:hypothetical protein
VWKEKSELPSEVRLIKTEPLNIGFFLNSAVIRYVIVVTLTIFDISALNSSSNATLTDGVPA